MHDIYLGTVISQHCSYVQVCDELDIYCSMNKLMYDPVWPSRQRTNHLRTVSMLEDRNQVTSFGKGDWIFFKSFWNCQQVRSPL